MKVSKHICFLRQEDPTLWNYCQTNQIPVEQSESRDLISVDIYTDSEHWPWMESHLEKHPTFCLTNTEYSKEDLCAASWMRIRSIWRYGYPEPSDDFLYEQITYAVESKCPHCSAGLKQVAPFRIKKAPSWGRRHFFSVYWVEDELFVSDTARKVLEEAHISSISFLPVLGKHGKQEHAGVHQLCISHRLTPALKENKQYLKKTTVCPYCGTKKYCGNGVGPHQYKREAFEGAPDIVKSGDVFGGTPHIASHEILINQRVYQTLIEHKLDRSLCFEPIELV